MGGDRKKKFLCAAPRPSSWEEKADALLRSLGGDPKKRETVLRQTLSVLRERYVISLSSTAGSIIACV